LPLSPAKGRSTHFDPEQSSPVGEVRAAAFWGHSGVDSVCFRESASQLGRYTRRLRPTGMVNVSISFAPSPLANGSATRAPIFPFADEEVLSCAISAMRKLWRARCALR
jgi:hypothetical protein